MFHFFGISCNVVIKASVSSNEAISIPISSALRHSIRHAEALVVNKRGRFCKGTKKKREKLVQLS